MEAEVALAERRQEKVHGKGGENPPSPLALFDPEEEPRAVRPTEPSLHGRGRSLLSRPPLPKEERKLFFSPSSAFSTYPQAGAVPSVAAPSLPLRETRYSVARPKQSQETPAREVGRACAFSNPLGLAGWSACCP